VLAWSNSFGVPFVFDDFDNILANPALRVEDLSPAALWRAGRESPSSSRPLANASFAVNHWLGDEDVFGYHAVNLAIHLANGLLVLLLARFVLRRLLGAAVPSPAAQDALAVLAAMVFVLHPVQTQAVTYLVQRMTSLAAFFYLGGLLLFLEARRRRRGPAGMALLASALLCWLAALGCKQIAATWPAAAALCEVLLLRDVSREGPRAALGPALLAVVGMAAAAFLYLGGDAGAIGRSYADRDFTPAERLLTQPRVVVFYASLVLLPMPSRLNLLHVFEPSRGLLDPPTTFAALVALVALVVLSLVAAPRRPLAAFCGLWFVGHLVLESSVVGLEMAYEHRLYLPMVAVALAVAGVAARTLAASRATTIAAALVLIAALGAGTFLRNEAWRSRVSLWSDTVAKSPTSARAWTNLGRALAEDGQPDAAVRRLERALALDPDLAEAHYNLGQIALARGRDSEAAEHYRRALRADPARVPARANLAAALARQHRIGEAVAQLREAVALAPTRVDLHFNLAVLLEREGRRQEALRHYEAVLRLAPGDAEAAARAAALRGDGGG
jgi:tetratricopeptide (TPR) repeat protein